MTGSVIVVVDSFPPVLSSPHHARPYGLITSLAWLYMAGLSCFIAVLLQLAAVVVVVEENAAVTIIFRPKYILVRDIIIRPLNFFPGNFKGRKQTKKSCSFFGTHTFIASLFSS